MYEMSPLLYQKSPMLYSHTHFTHPVHTPISSRRIRLGSIFYSKSHIYVSHKPSKEAYIVFTHPFHTLTLHTHFKQAHNTGLKLRRTNPVTHLYYCPKKITDVLPKIIKKSDKCLVFETFQTAN